MYKFYSIFIFVATILVFNSFKLSAQCGTAINTLQYRVVDSSGFFVIQIRDTGVTIPGVTNPLPKDTMKFLGLVMGVKWPSTSTISLTTTQTYAPYNTCVLAGTTFLKSGFTAQSIGDAPAGIPNLGYNWVKNVWYNVFKVNYSGVLLSTDTFQMCECNFDVTTDPYFSYLSGEDYLEYSPSIGAHLKIVPTPTLSATISPNDTFCGPANITLLATSNATNIVWNDGTNTFSNNQTITVSSSKIYTVTATNTYGGTNTTTVSLTIFPVPIMSYTQGDIICNGLSAEINVSSTGGTSPVYGVGQFFYPAGTHTIYIQDVNGCVDNEVITITEPNAIVTSYTTVSPRVCHDGPATFNITASGTYAPYSNTGLFTTSADSTTVTITDSMGCEAYITFILPDIPISTFTTNYNSPLYSGDSLKIDIVTQPGWTNYALVTDTNSNTTQAGTSFYYANITSLSTANYHFVAIDSNGCDAFSTLFINITPAAVANIKAFLQGPYVTGNGLMHDSLRINSYIPTTEPYSTIATFTQVNGGGGETTNSSILNRTGTGAPVDWVFLQLRDESTPTTVLATKCVLITRNGNLINPENGNTNITFKNSPPGNYILTIKHRNHTGLQMANAVLLTETASLVDFTNLSTTLFGTNAGRTIGSIRALKTGDANKNKNIKYNGLSNDRLAVLARTGTATNTVFGYYLEDLNMDGRTRYNGIGNDRLQILGNLPNANSTFFEQTSN